MRPRTVAAVLVVIVTLLAMAAPFVRSYTRAAALLAGMTGLQGPAAEVLAVEANTYAVSEVSIPSRHGPLRGRLYVPSHVRRAIVLVPGLHAIGIDEPRLYNLAIQLAQVGFAVVTPEMPDLARFEVTARSTDMIEDAALWLSRQRRLTRDGQVGMVGISFAGGLSVVAAGRPALRDRVAFVFAFGGHASFPRVLRFLCTGETASALPPAGQPDSSAPTTYLAPHDYGVAVLLLGLADRMVPAEQAAPLREAILEFLTASCYDLINLTKAVETYRSADRMAAALPEPARTLMRYVNTRDVKALGPQFLAHLAGMTHSPALSADQSPPPAAPVYLLHGSGDNVVPAVESRFLARYLEPHTRVRLLLSGLITHAELNDSQALADAWALLDFFADLLRE